MNPLFISGLIEAVKAIIAKVIPDKDAAQKAAAQIDQLHAQGELDIVMKQLDINLAEAKSTNWFVAGWRPFIGWSCGVGLLAHFTGLHSFADGDTMLMLQVLGGLAGLRTIEKYTGSEGNR